MIQKHTSDFGVQRNNRTTELGSRSHPRCPRLPWPASHSHAAHGHPSLRLRYYGLNLTLPSGCKLSGPQKLLNTHFLSSPHPGILHSRQMSPWRAPVPVVPLLPSCLFPRGDGGLFYLLDKHLRQVLDLRVRSALCR